MTLSFKLYIFSYLIYYMSVIRVLIDFILHIDVHLQALVLQYG